MTDTNGTTAAEIDAELAMLIEVCETSPAQMDDYVRERESLAHSLNVRLNPPPVTTDAVQIDNAVTDLLTTIIIQKSREWYGGAPDELEKGVSSEIIAQFRHDLDSCGYAIVDRGSNGNDRQTDRRHD